MVRSISFVMPQGCSFESSPGRCEQCVNNVLIEAYGNKEHKEFGVGINNVLPEFLRVLTLLSMKKNCVSMAFVLMKVRIVYFV